MVRLGVYYNLRERSDDFNVAEKRDSLAQLLNRCGCRVTEKVYSSIGDYEYTRAVMPSDVFSYQSLRAGEFMVEYNAYDTMCYGYSVKVWFNSGSRVKAWARRGYGGGGYDAWHRV